jgi:hypothetical protein
MSEAALRVSLFLFLFAVGSNAMAGTSSAPIPPGQKVGPTSAVTPSWELNAGVPDSCSADAGGGLETTANINAPSPASEQGELTVQGVGHVGFTTDDDFQGVNPTNGFFIFVDTTYSVPAHTPITLVITTFNQPNFLGGVSFVDTHTWDCTTGEFIGTLSVGGGAGIPTLSAGGLLALVLLVLATAVVMRRRKG